VNGASVRARARSREDRAGDPLDGLVNLFDLGIVLAVGFLVASLASVKLAPTVLKANRDAGSAVVAGSGEQVRAVQLREGQRVVGRGEPIGTVYRLSDGRTVIVAPKGRAGQRERGGGAAQPSGAGAGATAP
jgi:hypothetical protein